MPKASGGFYAVRRGRTVGIWTTWNEAEASVKGFPGAPDHTLQQDKHHLQAVTGARHRKFPTRQAAQQWLDGVDTVPGPSSARSHPYLSAPAMPSAPTSSSSEWRKVWTDGASAGNGQVGARAGSGVHWESPLMPECVPQLVVGSCVLMQKRQSVRALAGPSSVEPEI